MDDDSKTKDETAEEAAEELNAPETSSESGGIIDFGVQINSHLARINTLKEDMKPVKEMLDSIFENDPIYKEKSEASKKAAKDKGGEKKRILNQPQAKELDQNLRDMKQEMHDLSEALSYYLREYQRATGANEFEAEDGELREIVFVAKLVRKTNLND